MFLSKTIKSAALALGLELRRYNVVYSEHARLHHLLRYKKVDLVLDVGASDGEYGRYLRQGGYGGAILSFEPLPSAHEKLEIAAVGLRPWHVAPRTAVGAVDGWIDINVAGNSDSSSILSMREAHLRAEPESRTVGVERVPIMRLDSFRHPSIENAASILLKIDTQGYELEVLKGALRLLERVVGLQIELSFTALYEGQPLYRSVLDWLSDRGFNLWGLIPGFVEPESGRLLQCDGLLFRD